MRQNNKELLHKLRIDKTDTTKVMDTAQYWPYASIAIFALIILVIIVFKVTTKEEHLVTSSSQEVRQQIAAAPALNDLSAKRDTVSKKNNALSHQSSTVAATVLNASGFVTARRIATISSKITGKVDEVFVEEGMHLEKGQLVAQLDSSQSEVELKHANTRIDVEQAALREIEANLKEANLDLQRAKKLASDRIISKSELDRKYSKVDALQASKEKQEVNVKLASINAELAQENLSNHKIYAPFSGVVIVKNAQPGEMISPISAGGGFTRTGICTLVDMESLEIEVDVNESYIGKVFAKQKVNAVLDAYPDWQIPAHVLTIVPTANRQKATIKVRIGFDIKDARILPDMGVKVTFFQNGVKKEALTSNIQTKAIY